VIDKFLEERCAQAKPEQTMRENIELGCRQVRLAMEKMESSGMLRKAGMLGSSTAGKVTWNENSQRGDSIAWLRLSNGEADSDIPWALESAIHRLHSVRDEFNEVASLNSPPE